MDKFFRVIIPTYGDAPYLKEAIESIKRQTIADDIRIIVVHDNFGNGVKNYNDDVFDVYSYNQLWNGGARNFGMGCHIDDLYTLFLDHDDTIPNTHVLEDLKNFIVANNYPDMIRLPYTKRYMSDGRTVTKSLANEKTLSDVIRSVRVAPWTKCIKSSVIPMFPENTVFEDVCHHLKSCDICNSYALFDKPVVEWRMWDGQTSKKKGDKWESSKWRFIADLKDLKLKKKEVRVQRNLKAKAAIENLIKEYKEGK